MDDMTYTEHSLLFYQGDGESALHICCRRKDAEMAKILVEFGANVDIQNVSLTPVYDALYESFDPFWLCIIQFCLQRCSFQMSDVSSITFSESEIQLVMRVQHIGVHITIHLNNIMEINLFNVTQQLVLILST